MTPPQLCRPTKRRSSGRTATSRCCARARGCSWRAARGIVGERFSAGPFGRPRDAYHSGEDGETFLAPNVWPSENEGDGCLREGMETYYGPMERLSNRVLRLVALAARAPPDFFEDKTDRHCSNLQVANYPTLRLEDWPDAAAAPPRKKAHALSLIHI